MTTSTINTTIPVAGAPISSAPIRGNFGAAASDINNIYNLIAGLGTGTVSSVSGTNANGIVFSISNPNTAPNITISLGAITPTSIVASGTITGSNLSGTNTGDQTNISGNSGTVSTINGLISQGTNITITGSGTSGSPYTITASATAATAFSALTSATNTIAAMVVGTGASLVASGSGSITATIAPSSTLTGTTLASNVVTSSLTSVGTLGALTVTGNITNSALTASSAVATDGSKNLVSVTNTGSGSNVLATSPTLVTPILGVATATSINITGLTASSAVATDGSKNLVSVTNTGTGNNVLATSPTLVTPALGVATATSINKVVITTPVTSSTLTVADGKAFTASNTLTLAGTDGSTLNINTGGTLGSAAFVATGTSGAVIPLLSGANTWSGVQSFNSSDFALKGSSSGSTIVIASATASGTITMPATNDTLVARATIDTLTHKTYDTAGTGNIFKINGVQITAISGNTGTAATTTGTFTSGHVATFDASGNIQDGGTIPGGFTKGASVTINPYATGSVVSGAHGLSGQPQACIAYLQCITGENGYSAGDFIILGGSGVQNTTGGFSFWSDSANFGIALNGSGLPEVQNKTTGTGANITAANWKIIAIPLLYN